jgi:hypothetical protein
MTTIAVFGAGGKMGLRCAEKLRDRSDFHLLCVEVSERGVERLRRLGLSATSQEEAARAADVVILAVPDALLGHIAQSIVPQLRTGAMLICLDPAAPFGGELPERDDITYFITHPCHPPLINDETDPDARRDFFGGVKAKQHIVCALMQGPESDYQRGVEIARIIFGPVMNAHRVTVEQMAILEPALSETVVITCLTVIREAIDEAVRAGVPKEAAMDFAFGHMNVAVGVLFGLSGGVFSDGALLAVERGKRLLFQPDWKKVFEIENVMKEVKAITHAK